VKKEGIQIFKAIALLIIVYALFFIMPSQLNAADSEQQVTLSSIIIKLKAGTTDEQKAEVISRNGGVELSSVPALRLFVVEVPESDVEATLSRYKADPLVESAEMNIKRKVEGIPSDFYYPTEQWALTRIGWESVFGSITPMSYSKVAVLDTGVDASHPELQGKVLEGMSVFDDSKGLTDSHGHGTWLSGIIAANTDNGAGIAGVAFSNVSILPVKVISSDGTGVDSDIIQGIIWAADNGADVILMGFSNPEKSSLLQEAIDYAWSKGVVLVASAGNDGQNAPTFPAGHRGVIGVSATTQDDNLAQFSNYGSSVFLAAPGTDIAATSLEGNYLIISGTSPSAAIVAAVAAFMKAVDPTLTNGIIVNRLAKTAEPVGTIEQTGNGRINMAAALADTSTEEIQPAGVDGGGGPYVGPYKIADKGFDIIFAGTGGGTISFSSVSPGSTPDACVGVAPSICSRQLHNNATGTLTVTPNPDSIFVGWSGSFENPGSTTCTGSTTSCTFSMGNKAQKLTATFSSACTAPSITVHPSSATKTVGDSVTFSVTATGTAPLSYQWRKNGSNIESATGSSYTISSVVVADAGNYDAVVTNNCGSVTSNAATLTVNKANQTITVTTAAPATAAYNSTFIVEATASSGLPVSITTTGVCSGGGTGSATITMTSGTGTCTVKYNQAGNENYNPAPEVTSTTTATKASATVTLSNMTQTYTGSPLTPTATTNPDGLAIVWTGVPQTNAGSYPVTASVNDLNYEGSASGTFVIAKAATTTTVTCEAGPFTYNGLPHTPCSAVVTGPGGLNQTLTVTYANNVNAGTATASASYLGGDNWLPSSDTKTFIINKADATCTINGYTGVYDGNPHGATGSCIGVQGETLSGLDLGSSFTNVPGGTANWTFTDVTGNYNNQSGSVQIVITARPITITADAKTKVYGEPDPALTYQITSGTIVSGDSITGSLSRVAGENVGTYAILIGTLTAGSNYDITFISANLTITQRPITITADDKSKVFGSPDPLLTFTIGGMGLASWDTIAVFSGSLTRDPGENIGNYTIRQGSLTANSNYLITSFTNGTLTITPAPTTSTVTVTPDSQQYSDKVTFEATLSPASINGQAPATSITFYVGSQNMGSCTLEVNNDSLSCKVEDIPLLENPHGNGQMSPGSKTVTAVFGGVNPNFTVNDATTLLQITREDARAYYTGDTFVSTGSSTSNTATVVLSATIKDITAEDAASDPDAGDIRNARVTFVDRATNTNIPGCIDLPVGLISASDTKVGTATCNWQANIGTSPSVTYNIGIIVNNYYTRNNTQDDTVVTVSKDMSNFITGGGFIVNQNSAGICAGAMGSKTNFGFNVKYNKSRTNLQGNMNIIIRSSESCTPGYTGPRVYQIKTNAMQNLTVDSSKKTATFTSKANIQDVTDPYNPIPIGGNGTLRVTMKDNGEPGSFDKIGITFWNNDGGLWFSSNWDGSKTSEQTLGGGNLQVR
jgi:hypothetical protein